MAGYINTIERLRTSTDGEGIVTLIGMSGCPLHCRYCINDFCHDNDAHECTPEKLYDLVKIDSSYFLMSGGGITFGGGEPLLQSEFIKAFSEICPSGWNIRIETSLNVQWESIKPLIPIIDQWIIDIKETDSEIYRMYTDLDNSLVLKNLERIYQMAGKEKIWIRIPLIPGFNDEQCVERSMEFLEGYDCIKEKFTYSCD